MFTAFFELLRARGVDVSLGEWMTLMEGLEKNLHRTSLTGFYELSRAVLVKSETDYDKFDQAFAEFFQDVCVDGELPAELLEWLNHPQEDTTPWGDRPFLDKYPGMSAEEIRKMLAQRLQEQTEEHNGGSYWVGTHGYSPFGNSGFSTRGIRVGGESRHRMAFEVAGQRRYRDFRKDNALDIRQFQMAFRSLRQYARQADGARTEFDVDDTVHATCDNGGLLSVRYKKPRKNTIRLLLLMDSGGSMDAYGPLCSMLFQAATKSNHFRELHTFYFHNCIFGSVYTTPELCSDSRVELEGLLHTYTGEYRVILVGDALMDPHELHARRYDPRYVEARPSGMEWLLRLKEQYPHMVWLNPEEPPAWGMYWGQTYGMIAEAIPMYRLTVSGLEQAMSRLMSAR